MIYFGEKCGRTQERSVTFDKKLKCKKIKLPLNLVHVPLMWELL